MLNALASAVVVRYTLAIIPCLKQRLLENAL
jgi:hypothetical protein